MTDCVFCNKIATEDPPNILEHRKGQIYSFEPLNPVTDGHRLFVPNSHIAYADDDPIMTGFVFQEAARWASENDDDFNLIVNGGKDAGQTVFHLHVHYVPRRIGDGFQLPWGGVPR